MPERDAEGRVKCKCGKLPEMDKAINLEGPGNTVRYRLECPACSAKGAPWRRSELSACFDWESKYWELGKGDKT